MALTKIDDRGLKTPIDLLDNEKIRFGTGNDLEIYHASSNNASYIKEGGAGNLYIFSENLRIENADGSDSYIEANNGGASELYWDGSKKFETTSDGVSVTGEIQMTDHSTGTTGMIILGADGDTKLYHNNSNAILQTNTGELRVLMGNDNGIIGKPNGAVELYHDNVKTFATEDNGAYIYGPEGGIAQLMLYADEGDDNPDKWRMAASASASQFNLYNFNDGAWETSIECNGSGAVELYYDNVLQCSTHASGLEVKTGSTGIDTEFKVVGNEGKDAVIRILSDDGDDNADMWRLRAAHVGNAFTIENYSSGAYQSVLKATDARAIELHYQGSKKFQTSSVGTKFYGNLEADDDAEIKLGNDGDLKIYHGGNNSYIHNEIGHLYIRNDIGSTNEKIIIQPKSGEGGIVVSANNNVELYYDDSMKFETTSTGVNVTGALTVNGAALAGGLSVADYYVHSQTTLDDGGSSDEGHFGGGNWTKLENASSSTTSVTSDAIGVFSFPSTGMYKIELLIEKLNSGSVQARIQKTTDNGSNWSFLENTEAWNSGAQGRGKAYFNCTNVSTHKVRMYVASGSGSNQTVEGIKAFIEKLN